MCIVCGGWNKKMQGKPIMHATLPSERGGGGAAAVGLRGGSSAERMHTPPQAERSMGKTVRPAAFARGRQRARQDISPCSFFTTRGTVLGRSTAGAAAPAGTVVSAMGSGEEAAGGRRALMVG